MLTNGFRLSDKTLVYPLTGAIYCKYTNGPFETGKCLIELWICHRMASPSIIVSKHHYNDSKRVRMKKPKQDEKWVLSGAKENVQQTKGGKAAKMV